MNITWITRSFLGYRVPVYRELNRLCGGNLTLIYNGEVVPEYLISTMEDILKARNHPMKGEIRIMGKKIQPIATTSSTRKGIRIPIQPRLISTIKATAPEVLLTDGFFQWTYGAIVTKLLNHNVAHVMCYEGWNHTEKKVQTFRKIYRKLAMRTMDAIVCNGVLCREYVSGLGYPESKLFMGNMAADNLFFSSGADALSRDERQNLRSKFNLCGTVFLFSGRLVKLKGLAELFKAWSNLPAEKKEQCTLLIIGDGPERIDLESSVRAQGLTNIIFAGHIDYRELPRLYAACDVFCIPTLQDNWSLVVPEAMACGLPVMCSCYNGCYPELVKPENGWIFDPLDTSNTTETLCSILSAGYKLKEMGMSSQKIVSAYSPENIAANIYQACIHSQKNKHQDKENN